MRYNSNTVFQQFDQARILDDVRNTPLERLKVSVGQVFGTDYYTVEPIGGNWLRMEQWAVQTFGTPGSVWNQTQARWYMNDRKFWFQDEADRTMFLLKWA